MVLGVRNPGQHNPDKQTMKLITEQQFRVSLKNVDTNGDGLISWHELKEALRALGINWATVKALLAVVKNDLNHNHYIDGEQEIKKLKDYAAKHWNIVVTA